MRNILNHTPTKRESLFGRARYSMDFIAEEDIRGKKVIEIGFGSGSVLLYLRSKGAKSIVGIDLSSSNIVPVSKFFEGDPKVTVIEGDILKYPFEENSFDTILAFQVLEHLPEATEKDFFKKLKMIGKQDCSIYLATPYDSLIGKITDPAFFLTKHRHYSVSDYEAFSNDIGFTLDKTHLGGGFWAVIGIIDLYVSKWIFRRPPILDKYYREYRNKEYYTGHGFTDIFVKIISRTTNGE